MLKFVPEIIKTYELYHTAVKKNGWALQFVPEALKTAELCSVAIQNQCLAHEFVPETLKAEVERLLNAEKMP